jgi:hypothetical protein
MSNILIVPGLHPPGFGAMQYVTYNAIAALWRADGHNTQVHQFGWYEQDMTLKKRQAELQDALNKMGSDVYAIGVSAGGLAVLGAFANSDTKLVRIVTIATPLNVSEEAFANFRGKLFIPPVLETVYAEADTFLKEADDTTRAKIASIRGIKDHRVPPTWSRREGISNEQVLPTTVHSITIFSALTVHRKQVQELLF